MLGALSTSIPIIIIIPKKPIRIQKIEEKEVFSLSKITARGKIKNIFEKLIIVKLEIGIYFRAVKVKNIADIPNMVLKK